MQIYRMTTKPPEDGNFELLVMRTEDMYVGELTIVNLDTHETVVRERVRLSYGARFGPDVQDVHDWENRFGRYLDTERVK